MRASSFGSVGMCRPRFALYAPSKRSELIEMLIDNLPYHTKH
jgi:hypothetical protein